jgi:hypothetical protein
MSLTDLLLYLAVLTNVGCTAWNIACARRYIRALDAMAAERAELLSRLHSTGYASRVAYATFPNGPLSNEKTANTNNSGIG